MLYICSDAKILNASGLRGANVLMPNSEELNPLQALLLVFVKFGLSTPYDLMSQAGMSVGLTSPALKRLEKEGLLTCVSGPRNRMRYSMTEKGEDKLRASLESGQTRQWRLGRFDTFESAPRAIFLAWASSGVDDAQRCVSRAAKELEHQSQRKQREAEELHDAMLHLNADLSKGEHGFDKGVLIATVYRWMKVSSDAALLKMQADAIGKMSPLLPDLPPAPQIGRDQVSRAE
jgi:DNA-binding PadR family transcriptional regulator